MEYIEFMYKNKILLQDDLKNKFLTLNEEISKKQTIQSIEKWISDKIINEFNSIVLDKNIEDKFTAICDRVSPYTRYSSDLDFLITYATLWLCSWYEKKKKIKKQITYLIYHKILKRYKIGRTFDIKERIKNFNLWKDEVNIIHIINYDIENKLHRKFKEKRLQWEWFDLNNEDVEYIKSIT